MNATIITIKEGKDIKILFAGKYFVYGPRQVKLSNIQPKFFLKRQADPDRRSGSYFLSGPDLPVSTCRESTPNHFKREEQRIGKFPLGNTERELEVLKFSKRQVLFPLNKLVVCISICFQRQLKYKSAVSVKFYLSVKMPCIFATFCRNQTPFIVIPENNMVNFT